MKILFNKYIGTSRILFLIANIIILTLLIIGGVVYNSIDTKNLSQYYLPSEEFLDITKNREPAIGCPVTEIRANGYKLIKNANSGDWFYSLIEGNKNAKNPKLKFYTTNPDIKIASMNKQINEEDIANNIPLKFAAYDDDSYYLFNITCTTLPVMSLKNGHVYLFDNRKNAVRRIFHSYAEYKPRGRFTKRFYLKKSLSLKLKTYSPGNSKRPLETSLLGLPKRSHWHLYAAYKDDTKIRNVFTSKLWKESCAHDNLFNLDNGYEYKFVELFKEGQFEGLYALGYPMSPKQLGINLKKDEYMYKKSGRFEPFRIIKGNRPDNLKPVDEYVTGIINSHLSISQLYENTDIINAVDFWLFTNIAQLFDSAFDNSLVFHNIFYTRKKYKDGYKFMFTPWDLECSWGCFIFCRANSPKGNLVMLTSPVYSLLSKEDDNIINIINDRYNYLRKHYWNEEFINPILDEYENNVFNSGAYIRERKRWPKGAYIKDTESKLTDFRKYVKERLEGMDLFMVEFNKNPLIH